MPASASCRALTPVGHDMTFNGGDEASMHTHFFPPSEGSLPPISSDT